MRGERGDIDGAFALLRRATELAPEDPAAWLRLGILLDKQGRHEEAIAVGRRIVALQADHRLGRLLTARNLHALGDIAGTAAEYRALIALGDRAYQAAWFGLVDLKTVPLDAKEVARARTPRA